MSRLAADRDRGQVIVIFALALFALMGAAGLAVDIGRFYTERRWLQNAADAAALAAANSYSRGDSQAIARAEALSVLTKNFVAPPNGVIPWLPPSSGSEVYASGHSGDPSWLLEGILFSGGEVRVAIHNHIPYTFGRIVGLGENVIYAQAKAQLTGDLLPIAVRHYINLPGDGTGVSPCTDDTSEFMDFFATADTACLGTDSDASLRVSPNAGAAFSSSTPDNDRTNHGPIVEILGQGADPDNGADFRGFVTLDIRNYSSATSQLYYNGVTSGMNENTIKDIEAAWFTSGGYPGPMFPDVISPPDPNLQVGIMSGNASGIAVTEFGGRFAAGDEILVAVYSGLVMEIPDFAMSDPGTLTLGLTGTVANAGSFKASRNNAFSGIVDLSTTADTHAADAAVAAVCPTVNPFTAGITGGTDPITYTPDPVTPGTGSGTTVSMQNVTTPAGATAGIHTLWLRGEAGSPYLTIKYQPFAVKIGNVTRDFALSTNPAEQVAATGGDDVTFTVNVKRSGTAFGSSVQFFLEPLPGESMPTGLGTVTWSSSSATPTSGGGTNVTLTIDTGTMSPGTHKLAVRACGVNNAGQQVTHVVPITVGVQTGGSGLNDEYVDIQGFAVMRVATVDSNTVTAYAITPVVTSLDDPQLRRGQVARLVPWD
jgi:hypothetical protein